MAPPKAGGGEIYPVGSIYLSLTNVDPKNIFGGNWERLGTGRVLVAAGGGELPVADSNNYTGLGNYTGNRDYFSAGETGGEVSHALSLAEMPNHRHTFARQEWFSVDTVINSSGGSIYSWKSSEGGTTSKSYAGSTDGNGGNVAHNNMQPYLAVYMWKRVS